MGGLYNVQFSYFSLQKFVQQVNQPRESSSIQKELCYDPAKAPFIVYHAFCALMNPPATSKRYDAIKVRFKHRSLCVNLFLETLAQKYFSFQ